MADANPSIIMADAFVRLLVINAVPAFVYAFAFVVGGYGVGRLLIRHYLRTAKGKR